MIKILSNFNLALLCFMKEGKREVVACDFDGTLYKGDSFLDFSLFSLGKMKFFYAIMKASPAILAWKLGLISNGKAKETLFAKLFKGMKYSEYLNKCRLFANVINSKINPLLLTKLNEYKKRGAKVYIISASPYEWIQSWNEGLRFEDVVGTIIEVKEGIITGRFASQNCYGKEKVNRLLEKEPGRDSYSLLAFGDSKGDEDLFKFSDRFEKIKT